MKIQLYDHPFQGTELVVAASAALGGPLFVGEAPLGARKAHLLVVQRCEGPGGAREASALPGQRLVRPGSARLARHNDALHSIARKRIFENVKCGIQ